MSKKTTKFHTYEIYNHKILWGTARRNLALAQDPAEKDKMFWALGAMILTYRAFEGYLNWLGASISPVVWKEERKFFSWTWKPLFIGQGHCSEALPNER